jgi:8-amino-7-oxononanoate synthase
LGAIDAALELVPGMEAERVHLAALAEDFRARLRSAGADCGASSTQIVPLMVGAEQAALDLAAALKREGLLAIAIRPPTVPPGGSRLRFAFAAHHRAEDVARLADALAAIREAA